MSIDWFSRTLLLLGFTLGACNSSPSRDELGQILYKVPETPETQKPYELRELAVEPDEAAKSILRLDEKAE